MLSYKLISIRFRNPNACPKEKRSLAPQVKGTTSLFDASPRPDAYRSRKQALQRQGQSCFAGLVIQAVEEGLPRPVRRRRDRRKRCQLTDQSWSVGITTN